MSEEPKCPECNTEINVASFHCECGQSAAFVCESCGMYLKLGKSGSHYTCQTCRIGMTERGKVPEGILARAKELVGATVQDPNCMCGHPRSMHWAAPSVSREGCHRFDCTCNGFESLLPPNGRCECGVQWDDHPYDRATKGKCELYLLPLVVGSRAG